MWFVIIISIVILMVFIVILLSKIKVDIWVRKNGKDDEVMIHMKLLYGVIKLHYEIPVVRMNNLEEGVSLEVNKKTKPSQTEEQHDKTEVDKKKVDEWISRFHEILEATLFLKVWLRRTFAHLNITKLEWATQFSVGDAAYTAVASGIVWSTKTFLMGWLSSHVRMKITPRLFVVPAYDDRVHLSSEISCIVQISCGYAIYAGLVLMVRVLKVKGGVKRWRTILSKA
ncbi:DUF2953 domain-containing protein [Paenibacillus sp. CMAA1364]